MDFETTLPTLPTVPLPTVTVEVPRELQDALRSAVSFLPAEVDFLAAAQFILFFAAATMIFGFLGRMVLGKRSSLNHSLSSSIGILFIYVLTIIVYTFKPWELHGLLSPLPFVTFTGDYLILFPMADARFPALCSEMLSLVILAFLVNLIDSCLPRGKHFLSWYLLRFFTVVLSMLLHYFVRQALHTFLPNVLVAYAPMILLVVLMVMLLSGILSLLLGLVISVASPFLGAMYSFFFSSLVGKQLSKAVFSSTLLVIIAYLLEYFGYTVLCITASALLAYIPLVILLLALWYLIGHVL